MVFSNLRPQEKDDFFALLDEYFASRPHIFAGTSAESDTASTSGAAAAASVHRALASNPETTSKLIASGIKHGVPKNSPYAGVASNPDFSNAMGRMAAMSLSRSANNPSGVAPTSNNLGPPPPPPPRRASSSSDEPEKPPTQRSFGAPSRKFGDVDTSSAKNMFTSLRSSTGRKSEVAPAPVLPPALSGPKKSFAPPPIRREPSATSVSSSAATPPPPPARIQSPPEEDEEEEGEWATVLYDYSSEDPGDLQILEKQRILVTDKTSADWWTGKINGKTGLFPASYVQIL